jgi:hypothetical protein
VRGDQCSENVANFSDKSMLSLMDSRLHNDRYVFR